MRLPPICRMYDFILLIRQRRLTQICVKPRKISRINREVPASQARFLLFIESAKDEICNVYLEIQFDLCVSVGLRDLYFVSFGIANSHVESLVADEALLSQVYCGEDAASDLRAGHGQRLRKVVPLGIDGVLSLLLRANQVCLPRFSLLF